jgi:hypothetical protein
MILGNATEKNNELLQKTGEGGFGPRPRRLGSYLGSNLNLRKRGSGVKNNNREQRSERQLLCMAAAAIFKRC